MGLKAGVWMDHRKAVIVRLSESGEEVRTVVASAESPPGGAKAATRSKAKYTPNDFVAEDARQRKQAAGLKEFYDEVLSGIKDAEAVALLGPGVAKTEFKKCIKSKALLARIAEPEAADKMTDRQFAAKIRQHFAAEPAKKPVVKKQAKAAPAKRAKK